MSALYARSANIDIFPLSIDRVKTKTLQYVSEDSTITEADYKDPSLAAKESYKPELIDDDTDVSHPEYYNGRNLSEHSIGQLIQYMTDNNCKSYIVDASSEVSGENETITSISFIYNGHWFTLTDTDLLNNESLYVSVMFDESDSDYTRILGWDQKDKDPVTNTTIDKFHGVEFYTARPSDSTTYLTLIESRKICYDSYRRFTTDQIKNIDGGTI